MLIDLAKDLLRILRVELPENGNNCQLSETTLVAEKDTELKTKRYNVHIIYILYLIMMMIIYSMNVIDTKMKED